MHQKSSASQVRKSNIMKMVNEKVRNFIVVCQLIDTAPELIQRRGQSLTVFFVRDPK